MVRARQGEFRACLNDQGAIKTTGNLTGMRGYTIGYDDVRTGVCTFLVHFFMDDDGNVGASGLEDPKWLYEDGIAYFSSSVLAPP